MSMKQVKITEAALAMLKDLSKRKDSLALAATLEDLIMTAYKHRK